MPQLKDPVPFDYQPSPPYYFSAGPYGLEVLRRDVIPTLEEAVELFARHAMPVNTDLLIAVVCDRDGVIVVNYTIHPERRTAHWGGIRAGFAALERLPYLDPLHILDGELAARKLAETVAP